MLPILTVHCPREALVIIFLSKKKMLTLCKICIMGYKEVAMDCEVNLPHRSVWRLENPDLSIWQVGMSPPQSVDSVLHVLTVSCGCVLSDVLCKAGYSRNS